MKMALTVPFEMNLSLALAVFCQSAKAILSTHNSTTHIVKVCPAKEATHFAHCSLIYLGLKSLRANATNGFLFLLFFSSISFFFYFATSVTGNEELHNNCKM